MFDPAVIVLSFLAGAAIFFSPCGIALLPAYVSYLVTQSGSEDASLGVRARQGFRIGLAVSGGLILVFLTLGVLVSLAGNVIAPYATWVAGATGVLLVALGVAMLVGRGLNLRIPHALPTDRRGFVRYLLYGVGYALGGISCTLPAFLLVVFASLGSGTFAGGAVNFVAFTAGTVLLMLVTSVLSALSGEVVARSLRAHLGTIHRVSAVIIIGAGAYLLYFQLRAFGPLSP